MINDSDEDVSSVIRVRAHFLLSFSSDCYSNYYPSYWQSFQLYPCWQQPLGNLCESNWTPRTILRPHNPTAPKVRLNGKILNWLLQEVWTFPRLLVTVGDRDPRYRSGVTAQEEKRDVAGSGHQVDQHGHSDSTQSWQVELLHQQAPEEDSQTGTGDGCHACTGADKGVASESLQGTALQHCVLIHQCSLCFHPARSHSLYQLRPVSSLHCDFHCQRCTAWRETAWSLFVCNTNVSFLKQ